MRRHLVCLAEAVVLCVCAVAVLNGVSSAEIPDSAKALAALDNEWSKAANAGDVERVVSYYAEDAMVYPPNDKMVSGTGIKEVWAEMLADTKTKLTWKTTSAGVDHNTGFTAGTYEVTSADGTSVVEKGKYLCVWRKGKDGKWKAIHDMWNSDTK
jgi:ketosteroid isomerase-like protein